MKKMMRALVTFLTLCSLIASQAAALRAEENQGYGYSLTLSSGSGAFTEIMADAVTVNGNPVQATATDHEVTISGLHYGDAVQLNVQTAGAVTHADGRYHVRGYRLSGRDAVVENNEVITVKATPATLWRTAYRGIWWLTRFITKTPKDRRWLLPRHSMARSAIRFRQPC